MMRTVRRVAVVAKIDGINRPIQLASKYSVGNN
jgi:hypothetical protein